METYNLWENNIPLFDENIKNKENENACQLDAYLVEDEFKEHKIRGAMVILGGGGYGFCSQAEGEKVARWLNFFGVNAFVLRYRTAPYKHPAPLLDAKRAIRYVRYNAEKFSIDPDKVGIIGFSAGGHLAGLVATFFDKFELDEKDAIDKLSAKPNLAVLSYPVISLSENYAHQGSATNLVGNDEELKNILSLEKSVHENMPEMFLWHTLEDTAVSAINTLQYGIALKNKNIPYSLHIFNKGPHATILAENIEETKEWSDSLKTVLKNRGFIDKQSYRWL